MFNSNSRFQFPYLNRRGNDLEDEEIPMRVCIRQYKTRHRAFCENGKKKVRA